MSKKPDAALITQLVAAVAGYDDVRSRAEYDDLSGEGVGEQCRTRVVVDLLAAIENVGGDSTYTKQARRVLDEEQYSGKQAMKLAGIAQSLKGAVDAGYLQSAAELVHGELFSDFLEMAAHLAEEGYKDAAAVVAGSTLEGHLRQLCLKHSIPVEIQKAKVAQPKKADLLNSELAAAKAYSKLDQKNVTAWLDLRNKAAHGQYAEYAKEQVDLLIASIRDFLTRCPA